MNCTQYLYSIDIIYCMKLIKKKGIKILLSVLLLLLVIIPSIYFLIYPQYSSIKIVLNDTDINQIFKKTWTFFLISIAPPEEEIRGITDSKIETIEETVSGLDPLKETILEDLNTFLYIDSIDVEGNISEGISSDDMNRGFWHFPTSVYPGEKGNSIIIGHRFQYIPPARNTFYNLDKVEIGDEIVIKNDIDTFTYVVTKIEVVEKNDVSILQQSSDYRLTLVTCTPLWTSKQRLVITAKLDRVYMKI